MNSVKLKPIINGLLVICDVKKNGSSHTKVLKEINEKSFYRVEPGFSDTPYDKLKRCLVLGLIISIHFE